MICLFVLAFAVATREHYIGGPQRMGVLRCVWVLVWRSSSGLTESSDKRRIPWPELGPHSTELGRIRPCIDQTYRPPPSLDRIRPMSAKGGPGSTKLCPQSTKLGPDSTECAPTFDRCESVRIRIQPIVDGTLPNCARRRPTVVRHRPNLHQHRHMSANVGPRSANFGPGAIKSWP